MLPTLVLVGRPNVGKSTLFNRLTQSRDALVADMPGLTRDRHYGRGLGGEGPYLVVDTGGLEPHTDSVIFRAMARQTLLAIDEADVILFMVDGRVGVHPHDAEIAQRLRRSKAPVLLVVNKTEGAQKTVVRADFYALGLGEPVAISSAHGEGVQDLIALALASFKHDVLEDTLPSTVPHVAIVGRPNVGKSTFVNALLGEERMLAMDSPGTTRDAIHIPFEKNGRHYMLIDTAGVRRRGKVFETIEKFSVIKTMQAIESTHVVVLVLDGQESVTEQDAHLAAYILDAGRALVVAVNKWDALSPDARTAVKADLARKLHFLDFAETCYISALKRKGFVEVLSAVDIALQAAMAKLPTPALTRVLAEAVLQHQPAMRRGVRPKLRYAHQGGNNPPRIIIHGSHLGAIQTAYTRFLEKTFRRAFELTGTPLRVEYKEGANPYSEDKPKRKLGIGVVTMRRRKNLQREALRAKKAK